jgi:hypothetical protein
MVCAFDAVLLLAAQAELAASADATCESDADEIAKLEVGRAAGTYGHNSTNTFVTADVWELDLGDWSAVSASCCAGLGVEICVKNQSVFANC